MVGEHIRALKGGRWVHAIDCGDETVLHLVPEAPPPRVRRAYRPEFVSGSQAVETVTHREPTFAPREVVRRAYSRASDPALAAMFRDSQAFAEWCKTGRLPGTRNVALEVPGASRAAAPAAAKAAARKAAPARPKSTAARRQRRKAPARAKARRAARKPAARTARKPTKAARKGGARKKGRR